MNAIVFLSVAALVAYTCAAGLQELPELHLSSLSLNKMVVSVGDTVSVSFTVQPASLRPSVTCTWLADHATNGMVEGCEEQFLSPVSQTAKTFLYKTTCSIPSKAKLYQSGNYMVSCMATHGDHQNGKVVNGFYDIISSRELEGDDGGSGDDQEGDNKSSDDDNADDDGGDDNSNDGNGSGPSSGPGPSDDESDDTGKEPENAPGPDGDDDPNGNGNGNCQAGTAKSGKKCIGCAGGTYSAESNSDTCTPCAAGMFSFFMATECYNCDAGTYSQKGQGSCAMCPSGTFSNSSASACTACENGQFSSPGASQCDSCSS